MSWPQDGKPRYVWAYDKQSGSLFSREFPRIPGKGYVYDRANCHRPIAVLVAKDSHDRGIALKTERLCERLNAQEIAGREAEAMSATKGMRSSEGA